MSEKLKPCPFNQGKPEVWEGDNHKYYIKTFFYDENDDCIVTTFGLRVLENNYEEGFFDTEEQAIKAWNTIALEGVREVVTVELIKKVILDWFYKNGSFGLPFEEVEEQATVIRQAVLKAVLGEEV